MTEKDFTEANRYYDAQKKVKEIREFYEHLTAYVLCNPIVVVVNYMVSPEYLWWIWSVMGWGIAIILHGFKVFEFPPFYNKKWENKKIHELLEKENKRRLESNYGNKLE